MKSEKRLGKRVVLGILLIGIIVISVSFVSAAWKDLFKFGNDNGGEGELPSQTATANVEVQEAFVPPIILWVSNLGASVPNNPGMATVITFNFTATINQSSTLWDPALLPGTNFGDSVTIGTGSSMISGNFTNFITSGEIPRFITDCAYLGRGNSGPQKEFKNYTCNVTQMYYDTPFTEWNISVAISNSQGLWSPVNRTSRFWYVINANFLISPDSVNWTALNVLDTNKTSTYITINNTGNTKMSLNGININPAGTYYCNLRVNATVLNGTASPPDTISPGNFTGNALGGASACNTPLLINRVPQNISVTVEKGATNNINSSLNFCLKQIPLKAGGGGLITLPQSFSTSLNTAVADQKWTLITQCGATI